MLRIATLTAFAFSLAACSLSGMLGGGGKVPPSLLLLTPEAASTGTFTRASSAGEAITIRVPEMSAEIETNRVAAYLPPADVAYIQDLQMADLPGRMLRELLSETIRRTTSRVVLDPGQTTLDPGLIVSGKLRRFGYDSASGNVVVEYDAALATAGGTRVETRRFEATAPADGTAATVGPALNQAANAVARDFAGWIAR